MISQSDYEEVLKKNEELEKKNKELMKTNEELVKKMKNEELMQKNDKSENSKLQEDSNKKLSSSSFMNSLSYHIIEEKEEIIYSPENSNFEIKEGILLYADIYSHFI